MIPSTKATKMTVEQIYDAAMKLSSAEREELRLRLDELPEFPGEESTGEEYRRAWGEELQRRMAAVDRGELAPGTAEEVLQRIRTARDPGCRVNRVDDPSP
jgi:hypothetical protein